jgi:hypothetical protein
VADLATLQARLDEAELAYHKLLTGTQEIEVQHGDMKTSYFNSVSGMERLGAYIESLKSQIAAAGGSTTGLPRRGIVVEL